MNILNLFRPSATEQQLESELNGSTLKYVPRTNPPKRGTTPTEAGADELHQLRASLADIEARLSSVTHERDGLRNDLKASQKAISDLQSENVHLSHSLSKQIASSGLDAPVPGINPTDEQPHGLARSIAAAKRESANPQPRLQRPVI